MTQESVQNYSVYSEFRITLFRFSDPTIFAIIGLHLTLEKFLRTCLPTPTNALNPQAINFRPNHAKEKMAKNVSKSRIFGKNQRNAVQKCIF